MQCSICGSKNNQIIRHGVWDAPGRNVLACQKCHTVWLYPMMTKKEAEKFYARQGYQARLSRISAKNKRAFLEKKLHAAAKRQAGLLKSYLNKRQVLADVGASKGNFLQAVRPYVKSVVAIEPGAEEGRELKTKKIKRYSWLEAVPVEEKFNAVTMFHLFEHIDEPLSWLQSLKKHLHKNALVFVEVPNIDDALVSRYQCESFQRFYFQSMHCFYYNENTLSNIFHRAGFAKVQCHFIQRYPFSNHLQWLLAGKSGGNAAYEKKFQSLNKAYADILVKEKITDTIMCVFRLK